MAKSQIIELGGNKYSVKGLCSVTEQAAVMALKHKYDPNQIRNAWKQANGKSVREYSKEPVKEKAKRTRSPKKESNK